MKVLFDTNVVLDVLLAREPHSEASAAAWAAVEKSGADAYLSAHGVTTVYYLLRKKLTGAESRRAVGELLHVFRVASVDFQVIQEALRLPVADFEDAVTAAAASRTGCRFIVTRDVRGFRGSPVRILPPEALPGVVVSRE
jgi:predicted nucleic acid-binding protein